LIKESDTLERLVSLVAQKINNATPEDIM